MQQRKLLVTAALPYANGPIHLGHLLGYIQADIWVRFQRMRGHQVTFVCGADTHGTPIMIKANELGVSPEQMVQEMAAQQHQNFTDFQVVFDNFYTTHSAENQSLAGEIYQTLLKRGDISRKQIQHPFDPDANMFLPDRYVKGECPKCGAEDQYGDNCEACGATYLPTEMKNPVSIISGSQPILKTSEHLFFNLSHYQEDLKKWIKQGHLQPEVANKLLEWFDEPLKDWDISRDAPYFGFPIPGEKDKYFYVWLDAPIGYMASFQHYCQSHPELNFDDYWRQDKNTELYHFIGKDIITFHCLFWPAMLDGANMRLPTGIYANGYLTINRKKMSKSRGTFITAQDYLRHLDPEFLRYYFAAKLNHSVEDIDLNLDDFVLRNNADLVGKVVNIASRCAGFIHKRFHGKLAAELIEPELYAEFVTAGDEIATYYDQREYSRLVRCIMVLADKANQYIAEQAPWKLIKQAETENLAHQVCSLGLNLFRLIILYLKPITPILAAKVESFLMIDPMNWLDERKPLLDHSIQPFKPLLQRIEPEQVKAMQETVKQATEAKETKTENATEAKETKTENATEESYCTIDDLAKIDLRIGRIVEAAHVDGADKLLRLTVDLGQEKKQVFAGIKAAYDPEALIGRQTLIVANLKPRKMRFGLSEGMVLLAGSSGSELYLLSPDEGAKPGDKVK